MKNKIKFFPILVALVTCTSDVSFNLRRRNSFSGHAVFYEDDSSYSSNNIDSILSNLTSSITTATSTATTTNTSAATTTTTSSSATTTSFSVSTSDTTAIASTTMTTTESKYNNLMFLEDLNNNYDLDRINDIVSKYSKYCNISYDESISILNNNVDRIISYTSFEEGIMRTLFECCSDQGLLSSYCTGNKVTRSMDKYEMESIMLDICDVMGLCSDDKKIVLSIFRWETGNGSSYLCVNSNNYGGIRVSNGEFGIYQTPEYGMYRAITCMYGHISRARGNGCDDIYSILSNMSHAYCPGTADAWTNSIYGMVSNVTKDYDEKVLKKI